MKFNDARLAVAMFVPAVIAAPAVNGAVRFFKAMDGNCAQTDSQAVGGRGWHFDYLVRDNGRLASGSIKPGTLITSIGNTADYLYVNPGSNLIAHATAKAPIISPVPKSASATRRRDLMNGMDWCCRAMNPIKVNRCTIRLQQRVPPGTALMRERCA